MERDEKNRISDEVALKLAIARAALMFGNEIKDKKSKWGQAVLKKEPLKIYDMNGQLLFYEFDVITNKTVIGRIKASANKVLGPAIWTIEMGPRLWNPDKALKTVSEMFEKEYKDKPDKVKLVCYSYPKIGALASKRGKKWFSNFLLIDAATYQKITVERKDENEVIGSGTWSLFGSIPEKDKLDRIKRWERDENFVGEFPGTFDFSDTLYEVVQYYDKHVQDLDTLYWVNSKRLNLTQYGQEHCVWCACATGQMIMRYHHYYYEQIAIVNAMGTGWDQNIPPNCNLGGSSYTGICSGIEDLTRNYLAATVHTPVWSDIKKEIDNDRPFGSTVPGHIRACDGYKEVSLNCRMVEWPIYFNYKDHYLYVLDPWPPSANNAFCNPDGGAEYWEDFDAAVYWDFVYCRPCTGTMKCED